MPLGALFSLEPLPAAAVPSRKRGLFLSRLVGREVLRNECEYSTTAARVLPYCRDPRRTDTYPCCRRIWLA